MGDSFYGSVLQTSLAYLNLPYGRALENAGS